MQPSDPSAAMIAWWGAGLSTLLALVKLWELWRDRFQIEVSYNLRSEVGLGNDIYVRNLTSRPLILTHWELYYSSGRWLQKSKEFLQFADPEVGDQRIEPHTTHILHFADERHFPWGEERSGQRLYIQLFVAGRKPFRRLVYTP